MKKRMRMLFAFMLTCIMVLCMNMNVFAEDTYEITIRKAANDNAAHTYEVYQVFSGTLTTETVGTVQTQVLTGIQWGSGVNGADLLTALKDQTKNQLYYDEFSACTDAEDVARVVQALGDTYAETFASIVSTCLADGAAAHKNIQIAANAASGTLTGVDAGYYFICDKADSLHDGTTGEPIGRSAYTKFILKVVKDVDVTAKTSVPTLDKVILQPNAAGTGTDEVRANTASIGDDVNFRIKTAVPDTTAYETYFFVIKDKLSPGLTFKDDTLKVYQGASATILTKDTDYSVKKSTDASNNTILEIVLKNAKTRGGNAIIVEYSATLNEDADRTEVGNPNTADLVFSNDPNFDYQGTPGDDDYPGPGDVTGKTPDVQTKTYTTGIKLIKIDKDTKKTLTGAKFSITGDKVNIVLTTAEVYSKDAAGTFYKLKDGTYTDEPPTQLTSAKYESEDTYKRERTTTVATDTVAHTYEATVDANGYVTFEGLGAGTYTITEVEAPSGYSPIAPFDVVIDANPSLTGPGWQIGGADVAPTPLNPTTVKTYEIENAPNVNLPETGGIGTTVFYIVGGILVVLAGILLFVKLRMKKRDE